MWHQPLRFSSFALGTCPLIVADRDKPQRKQADAQHTSEVADDKTRSQGGVGAGKNETAPDLAMLMGLVKAKINASNDSSQTTKEADDRSGRVQARRLFTVLKACQAVPERVRGLMWLGMHVRFWYESALVVGVVFALAYQSPIATFVSLMDMLLWQSNATFVHALRNSALQIAGMVAHRLDDCIRTSHHSDVDPAARDQARLLLEHVHMRHVCLPRGVFWRQCLRHLR